MLTPDYQEFAKRAPVSIRDNTVICGLGTSRNARNPPGVAPLPRQNQHERGTLCLCDGIAAARQADACRGSCKPLAFTKITPSNHAANSCCLGGLRILGALVDHLIHKAKILSLVGGEEFVALQRVLDRLVGLSGVLDVDFVESLLQVQDFLRMQHDVGGLALEAA